MCVNTYSFCSFLWAVQAGVSHDMDAVKRARCDAGIACKHKQVGRSVERGGRTILLGASCASWPLLVPLRAPRRHERPRGGRREPQDGSKTGSRRLQGSADLRLRGCGSVPDIRVLCCQYCFHSISAFARVRSSKGCSASVMWFSPALCACADVEHRDLHE